MRGVYERSVQWTCAALSYTASARDTCKLFLRSYVLVFESLDDILAKTPRMFDRHDERLLHPVQDKEACINGSVFMCSRIDGVLPVYHIHQGTSEPGLRAGNSAEEGNLSVSGKRVSCEDCEQ